ncbi:MFS transporter [Dethiobacter alkaliphilus]|uniref:MFS transporter n=1 Tax=Dethiobacter alkaliphilus TaxID=427926 RepID=UPI00222687BD|nr:MFS transporter [Dethiobacter alkaliphilus]MCW3490028.1 MFS transporter [Dethiobacter alkaliphilus]
MPLYRGWKVALAGVGINFLVGINYTWSIFATSLVKQEGWTYYQAALPYSLFLFCYAFFMVFTGWAQDYLGPRPVISIGSIFAGSAFISCAYLLNYPFKAAVSLGLLLGIGLACCFASTTPAAMKWFSSEKKGMITGLVVTSTGLAAMFMSPLIKVLLQRGTAEALIISGLALTCGIFLLAQFIENPPYRIKDLREWAAAKKPSSALGDSRLYCFWLMFFLTTGTGVTFAAHLDNIMRIQTAYDKGYIAVAIFAFCNAAGRIMGGLLSDRVGRSTAMTIVFSNIALMLVIVMAVRSPIFLMVAVAALALSYGSLFSIFPSAVVNIFGEANFGRNYGLVFTALGAAGLFPYLGGILFELQGHYLYTYALLLGTTLTATLLSIKLRNSY